MNELQLDQLSVRELQELKDSIETAIRALIRQRAAAKAQPVGPAAAIRPKVDLEHERDAWIAKRHAKQL